MLGVLVTLAVLSLGVLLLLRCLAAWGAGGRLVSLASLAQGEARSGEEGVPGWQVFLWSFGFRVLLVGAGMLAAVLLSQGELSPEGAFRQLLRWDGNHYKNLVELGYAGYVAIGNSLTNPLGGTELFPTIGEGGELWYTPKWYSPIWQLRRLKELAKMIDSSESKVKPLDN